MNFQADDPTSPLFIVLLVALLVDIIFAWSGLVSGRLPTTRTSVRGARVAGALTAVSGVCVLIAYRYYSQYLEFFGTIFLAVAFGLFVVGLVVAERIPD